MDADKLLTNIRQTDAWVDGQMDADRQPDRQKQKKCNTNSRDRLASIAGL